MDYPEAAAKFRAIDEERCRRMLDVLVKNNASDAIVTELVAPLEQSRRETLDLIHELIPEVPEVPSERPRILIYEDLFEDVSPDRWVVYGDEGVGNRAWGQNNGRIAYYTPTMVEAGANGLTIHAKRGGAGLTASNGEPAWTSGFLTSRGTKLGASYPLFARFEVEARWTTGAGWWPCPLWLRSVPGGAGVAEVDVVEWFGNYPNEVRQATHLRRDYDGKTQYNVAPALLGKSHVTISTTRDIETYRTYTVDVTPAEQNGHVRFTYSINGVVTNTFSTFELIAKGTPCDDWIKTTTGWDLAICGQVGGEAGEATEPGPFSVQVKSVRVTQPG